MSATTTAQTDRLGLPAGRVAFTKMEVAAFMGRSRRWVDARLQDGTFRAIRTAGAPLITRASIEGLLRSAR